MTNREHEATVMISGTETADGTGPKSRVLFICTHNSARSQMAEGYLRAYYGDLFEAASAGTEAGVLNPLAVAVMEEIEIDISGYRAKFIDEFFDWGADIVVTVCDSAHQSCPFFPGAKKILHARLPDPSGFSGTPEDCLTQFRNVRNAIIAWIDTTFVQEFGYRQRLP